MSKFRALALGLLGVLGLLLLVLVLSAGNASAADSGPLEYVGDAELAQAAIDGECTGTGTEGDPYVFADYEFECAGSPFGLRVMDTTNHVLIYNCTFVNCTDYDGIAIWLDNVSNVDVEGCSYSEALFGIWASSSDHCRFLNNDLDSVAYEGIYIYNSYWMEAIGNHYEGTTAFTLEYGFLVSASTYVAINDTALTDPTHGIWVTGSDNVIVDHAVLIGLGSRNVYVESSSDVIVSNCTILAIHDLNSAILCETVSNIGIFGNTLEPSGDSTTGISLASCDNASISGNLINDSQRSVQVLGGTDVAIDGNVFSNSTDYVMHLTMTDSSVTNNTVLDCAYGIWMQNSYSVRVAGNDITVRESLCLNVYLSEQITVEDNLMDFFEVAFNKHILVSSCCGVYVRNNTLTGPAAAGIGASQCCLMVIEGNHMSIIGSYGIDLYQVNDTWVLNNTVNAGLEAGVHLSNAYDVCVVGNLVEDCSYGIHQEWSYDTLIEGNRANRSVWHGVLVENGGSTANVTVRGNHCADGTSNGIAVYDIGDVNVTGNDCSRSLDNGIVLSSSESSVAYNNTAVDCHIGLAIYDSAGCAVIGGNYSSCDWGISVQGVAGTVIGADASDCEIGIHIWNSNSLEVINCSIEGNLLGMSVYMDGSHETPVYIRGNLFQENQGKGLEAFGGSWAEVEDNRFVDNWDFAIDLDSTCIAWNIFNNTFDGNAGVSNLDQGAYQVYDIGENTDWSSWEGDRYYGNGWSHLPNVDISPVDGYVDYPVVVGGSWSSHYYQMPYGPMIEGPDAPTGLAVRLEPPYLWLNWTELAFGGNATVYRYKVYMGTSPGALDFLGEAYTPDYVVNYGLSNGFTYYFAVTAVNEYEFEGDPSDTVSYDYDIYPASTDEPFAIHSDEEFAYWDGVFGWQGDGSSADPYIIDSMIIDGTVAAYCLEITDTTAHFVLANCTFYFGTLGMTGTGLGMQNVINGRVLNCSFIGEMLKGIDAANCQFSVEGCAFTGALGVGVFVQYSPEIVINDSVFDGMSNAVSAYTTQNLEFTGNELVNCSIGVFLFDCAYVRLAGNIANASRFCEAQGTEQLIVEDNLGWDLNSLAYLSMCDYVEVRNNTAAGFGDGSSGIIVMTCNWLIIDGNYLHHFDYGIYVGSGHQMNITQNALSENDYGMWIDAMTAGLAESNEITGNSVNGLVLGDGVIDLEVRKNLFADNQYHGVYVDGYYAMATFHLNGFIGNNGNDGTYSPLTVQAVDTYYTCQWSLGGLGNLWADWTFPDDDMNGIVDIGYGDGEFVLDQYPLVHAFGIPMDLAASVGSDWVLLTWKDLSYDFSGGVDGFRAYISLDGISYSLLGTTSANGFNATGLTTGTIYHFRVAAFIEEEEGANSTVTAVPCNVPGAPNGLAVASGVGTLTLSWEEPADDGGSAITGYQIWRGISPSSLTLLDTIPTEMLEYGDGVLGNGETYYYAVRAINLAGAGAASATVGNTTFDLPGVPTNVDTKFGDGNITVTWDAPADDGGTPITNYVIEVSRMDGESYYYPGAEQRSWLVSMLTNGETYSIRIGAVNDAGTGDWSSAMDVVPATMPDPPTGLTAVPGEGIVTLSWMAPSDDGGDPIDSYNVYRWDISTAWSLIGTSTATTYVDDAVGDGMLYAYRVTAINKAGEGEPSDEVPVVPGLPLAPTGLAAVNSGGKVLLNWTAPADDGGSAIIDYKIYRDSGSGYVYLGHTGSSSLIYLDATAAPGIEHLYRVTAVTLKGEGMTSNEAAITLPLVSPEAPVIDSAVQGDDGVLLVWHVPESSTVPDQFLVYRGATPDGLLLIAVIDGNLREYLDVTGTAGTYYALRSSNEYGIGNLSEAFLATLGIVLPPEAPAGLQAIAGDSLVTLSWTASQGAVGYHVYRDNGTGYFLLDTASITEYADDAVLNGVPYPYRVTAYNDGGESDNSTTVLAIPGTVPGAVQNLTLTEGEGLVTLDWDAPADDGGFAVLGYRVYRDLNGTVTLLAMVSSMTYSDHAVISGLLHTYWIVALNAWGAGPESVRLNVTPDEIVVTGLPAPAYLLAVVGDGTVDLSWDPMTSFHVSGFRLYRSDGGNFTLLIAQPGSTYSDSGLVNGVTYTYRVHCFINSSRGENASVEATPGTVPGAATLNGQVVVDRATLSWTVPADGGSPVIGYRLYRTPGTGNTVLLASLTGTTYVDTNLLVGVNYTYMVIAMNAFGEGAPSNTVVLRSTEQVSPDVDVPAEPFLSSATGGNASIALLWNVPADSGDGPITGYNVYRGTSPLAAQLLVSVPAGTTSYVDGTVVYGTTYYYWVSALNQWGESEPSRMLSASLIALAVPGEVDVDVEEGQGRITLSWSVPDEGSSSVIEYRIYRRGETGDRQLIATVPAGTGTFVDGSVEAGQEYDYWVTAVNAAGEGPLADAPVSGVPLAIIAGEAEIGPLPMIAVALGAVSLLVAAVAVVLVLRRK